MFPPYYIVPLVEEYRTLPPSSPRAIELSKKIAANIGDQTSARLVLGFDPPELVSITELPEVLASSFDTIESFLDKFGKDLPPVGYVPEETSALQDVEQETDPGETPKTDPEAKELQAEESDPGLTETFASLVKQRRYHEALQFIKAQNLNNPNKSIYFAHQIRFLKKLIALENYKKL